MRQVIWLIVGMGWVGIFGQASATAASRLRLLEAGDVVLTFPALIWSGEAETSSQIDIQGKTDGLESPDSSSGAIAQGTPFTSVAELSDVQPTDWAYEALQSVIERYGIVTGYTDGTFRGDRPLTRYEFAAALNATLRQIDRLIGVGGLVDLDDIETLQRLQTEYATALQPLRDRLDGIESRTTELEANVFSPVTRLQGQVINSITTGTDANATLVAQVRFNLLTSFTPEDLLVTQLEVGNNGRDAIALVQSQGENLLGTDQGILADGGGLDYVLTDGTLRLNRLYYTWRPSSNLALTVGPLLAPSDWIDRNNFANDSAVDFSSSFFTNNPLIVQEQVDEPGGAGAVVDWNIDGGPFTVRSLYVAADAGNPLGDRGLFGDRHQGSLELQYSPNPIWTVRLQYTNAWINQTSLEAGGINAEWMFQPGIGVFGRYGFGNYRGFNSALNRELDLSPETWAIGLVFPDLVIPGSLAGIAIGQPFVADELGDANQANFEAFYNLYLSDNISITPALMVITNANNNSASPTVWQGAFRTVFSF